MATASEKVHSERAGFEANLEDVVDCYRGLRHIGREHDLDDPSRPSGLGRERAAAAHRSSHRPCVPAGKGSRRSTGSPSSRKDSSRSRWFKIQGTTGAQSNLIRA